MKKITLFSFCLLAVFFSCKENQEVASTDVNQKKEILSLDTNRGIINNTNSPNVKLKSIDIGDCRWTEGFWADKWKIAEEVMIPHMGEILKGDVGHGYNNFKIAAGLKEGEHKGFWWHDGDFYKWMEANLYLYGVNK
ncbi:MAG: glycoside hydrolase family 127 protein, partial [Maribacter dokdonensis]